MKPTNRSIKANFFRFFSWPLSIVYRLVVSVRNSRFDSGRTECYHATVPVISVGNLTTGGTGKTPLVRWVCRNIRDRWKKRVGLLSRGYQKGDRAVNDEAMELEWSLPDVPHLQDPDRGKMAEIAVEEFESECLVLDDAFQHRQIHRDLNLVVIDATNPFGYGYCLPRGLLREPISGLRRADAVVITRCDQVSPGELEKLQLEIKKRLPTDSPVCLTRHKPVGLVDWKGSDQSLSEIQGREVLAVCGIGNPDSFFKTIETAGGNLLDSIVFQDHHQYQLEDIETVADWCEDWESKRNDCQVFGVLTTVKDMVKIAVPRVGPMSLLAIEVQLEFLSGESELLALVHKAVDKNSVEGNGES